MHAYLGTRFNMIPMVAPWQKGLVERHGSVLGDIITATVMETPPRGFKETKMSVYMSLSPRTADQAALDIPLEQWSLEVMGVRSHQA